MASQYAFNLRGYSTDQLYDYLKTVWERARGTFKKDEDEAFAFRTKKTEVNLLGVRGFLCDELEPVENWNTVWDDTLFVIYVDDAGSKRVDRYRISTEHRPGEHMSLMMPGMYEYKLGQHKITEMLVQKVDDDGNPILVEVENPDGTKAQVPQVKKVARLTLNLKFDDEWRKKERQTVEDGEWQSVVPESYGYRALRPNRKVVTQIVDHDGNLELTPEKVLNRHGELVSEHTSLSESLNIHYGGEADKGPQKFSDGCQVIKGWDNYRKFLRTVEKDKTIIGADSNELGPPATAAEATRSVIYTLVEGAFLKPPNVDSPFFGNTPEQLFAASETGSGLFPVGTNRFWHGGVHLENPVQRRCGLLPMGPLWPTG